MPLISLKRHHESKHTGRKLLTICLLSFLCTGTTLPFFQSSGKVPNFKELQNIMKSAFIKDGQLRF